MNFVNQYGDQQKLSFFHPQCTDEILPAQPLSNLHCLPGTVGSVPCRARSHVTCVHGFLDISFKQIKIWGGNVLL